MSRAKALRSKRRKAWNAGMVFVWHLQERWQREHPVEFEAALARMEQEMDKMGLPEHPVVQLPMTRYVG